MEQRQQTTNNPILKVVNTLTGNLNIAVTQSFVCFVRKLGTNLCSTQRKFGSETDSISFYFEEAKK